MLSSGGLRIPVRSTLIYRSLRRLSTMSPRTVVALGGNALVRPGEEGTPAQQAARAREAAQHLSAFPSDTQLVVTHGNGPQVGEILLRSDLTADKFPAIPIDLAVAATQGQIGVMLQHAMADALRRPASTVCTTVVVDASDPDFQDPTKYVGRFYDAEEAEAQKSSLGWTMKEDPGRGFRRVVPSPKPSSIIEVESVRTLVASGVVVVACGGGGVPAVLENGSLTPVEAVVDKDLSSALLARELGATRFIILTAVDEVMVDYAKDTQRALQTAGVDELRQHAKDGQFPPGSMGPKIEAVLAFLEGNPGAEVLITSPEALGDALAGKRGTWIR
uniref:Carbamate kinase n=1 Tax=Haptolina ericina TaxID=156174 RepID=A0A7S3AVV1_9EUKA|mmetsp:Transcript_38605/g.87717  ORF Transcript_38605/g.87717 Transcript_38605/m.87717 type:complete len:332 (+) Transcript_38605:109-1104(+)